MSPPHQSFLHAPWLRPAPRFRFQASSTEYPILFSDVAASMRSGVSSPPAAASQSLSPQAMPSPLLLRAPRSPPAPAPQKRMGYSVGMRKAAYVVRLCSFCLLPPQNQLPLTLWEAGRAGSDTGESARPARGSPWFPEARLNAPLLRGTQLRWRRGRRFRRGGPG
jgi:hypothetical protein